ncbi:UDP-N-acetylmuramoyl-L-alanyl-D-glutamate--2,6-diaminopimelate ligase [Larsenimonas rhizosphaerae]|uniref:UDP-N-acetylmuramoyl-L-alanyl-D-glutamate--2,6-diaminopimelate ligase n=1 Tax=Larsenimonas rhizosphaerae TaxID=2944682 RepID=A0AA41ZGJ5_9GAMM|nr:UDP-N-acetylmuramoyl-L-alanyl-D-glutamate--2,6-diaminopimelate ligase [Larsenimonas rhizosphaerae]MCX2523754.1 UDP-N-acetylmuramoyl-L-alanyl-D-glutamate--2,6-diaminopimelate ligase [Larsenimonas rhizosphaerae]
MNSGSDTVTRASVLQMLETLWPGNVWPVLPARTRLVTDSRLLRAGDVFLAVPGVVADGRDYIVQALQAEAGLVLAHVDDDAEAGPVEGDHRVMAVTDLKGRLGVLARGIHQVSDSLFVSAVTGTNGKSSVAHYLASLTEAVAGPCGLMGTLGVGRPGQLTDTGLTTPGIVGIQAALGALSADGVTRVVLEASSHALDQDRLAATPIHTAIFTNLTRDHLDYHGSMAAYAAAKARLFRRPELALAVVNEDDPLSRLMVAGCGPAVRVLRVGHGDSADFRVLSHHPEDTGQSARVMTPEGEVTLSLGLMGHFNLTNALLALAAAYGQALAPLEVLLEAMAQLAPVPGRMERIAAPGPTVIIDYAHTPDALTNALEALRDHVPGRLWCLVGCGGDRDSGKRPLMARAACDGADRLVITDDNPRSESAAAIRDEMLAGVKDVPGVQAVADRRQAIEQVIREAALSDVILIAGKGHETYQEIAGIKHPFSDHDIARTALEARHDA